MLHKQNVIAVGKEPPSAFLTLRVVDEKETQNMDKTSETKQLEGEFMMVSDRKRNQRVEMEHHRQIKISNEYQKTK